MVQCIKLGKAAEGLDRPPFKGEFGQRIFEHVSKEAWGMWIDYSKVLINELRLDLTSERGQQVWLGECRRFFFAEE